MTHPAKYYAFDQLISVDYATTHRMRQLCSEIDQADELTDYHRFLLYRRLSQLRLGINPTEWPNK